MPQHVTPRGLFRSGVALIVVATIANLILPGALVGLSDYFGASGRAGYGLIFAVTSVIAMVSMPLGAGLTSAALVLRGLEHKTGSTHKGPPQK